MKKTCFAALALCSLLVLCACGETAGGTNPGGTTSGGNKPSGNRGEGEKIVIYCGGSMEYSVVAGSEEDKVIEAIEQKYWEDTGISLDFEVNYLGTNMQGRLASSLAAQEQVDIAISHTRYDSGIDDYSLAQGIYYDLADIVDLYGPKIKEKTDLDTLTTFGGEVVGIPSYVNPYKFGILVRKDYMRAVGYTDDADEAASKGLKLLQTIGDFTEMCKLMKDKDVTGLSSDSAYSVSGAIWDLEKVFAGAYGDAGYFSYQEIKNGAGEITSVAPGFATEAYQDLLKLEYDWVAKDKILSATANTTVLDASEGEFISGKTGVFVTDPTVSHLIRVARKTKQQNADAEFTVLGPLANDTTGKKGFIRTSTGYKAAIVMKSSKQAANIVKFLNWMYTDEANYNLCRYGVEGEHWVNNGDGTYSYPQGKEEYLTRAPYSGILSLVENENMSDLLYSGYSDEERGWIELSRKAENYVENDVIDYVLPRNAGMTQLHSTSLNNYYNSVAVPAWYGTSDPNGIMENMTRAQYYRQDYLNQDNSYLSWLTEQYKLMKTSRG